MRPAFDPQAFAARLARAIATRGTIDKAAETCGLPRPSLEAYLYRQNLPGARALAALARGLDVSIDWLLFGEVIE